jgi:hypothetical protein
MYICRNVQPDLMRAISIITLEKIPKLARQGKILDDILTNKVLALRLMMR